MKHALFVIPLLLVGLAAAPQPAAAETDSADADATAAVTILGTTFCMPNAAPDADCDVRIGSHPNVTRALGMTICTGPVPSGITCDVDLAPHKTVAAQRAIEAAKRWMLPIISENLHADRVR